MSGVDVRMPPDGSCLFYSLAHGLGGSGEALRAEICDFIEGNPDTVVGNKPMRDWVLWEAGQTPTEHAACMRQEDRWGGAVGNGGVFVCPEGAHPRLSASDRRSLPAFLRV